MTSKQIEYLKRLKLKYCQTKELNTKINLKEIHSKNTISQIEYYEKELMCDKRKQFKPVNVEEYIIKNSQLLYEIGYQKHYNSDVKFEFIKFNNILMCDIDHKNLDDLALNVLLHYPSRLFHIYETTKGYHLYCVSHFFDPKSNETYKFMTKVGCDDLYKKFCYYYNGFVIRAIRKRDDEPYIERFIGEVGFGKAECNIMKLMCIKDKLTCN